MTISNKAFAVQSFTKEDKQKSAWTEIGGAWSHKHGKGFDLKIHVIPLSGRIVLREPNKGRSKIAFPEAF